MRKIFTLLLVIFIFTLTCKVYAQRNSVKNGIGVIVGGPTGISIKFLNSGYRHFNGAVAWNTGNDNKNNDGSLYLHADYIFAKWNITTGRSTNFQTFIGAGLAINTGAESTGIRVPFGLGYIFNEVPIDAYVELVPVIGLIPSTGLDIDAAIAIRFLF